MDEYVTDQVLCWYERIERGILDFMERVPLLPQNEDSPAPVLITHLMDTCGLLDSVFRDLTPDPAMVDGQYITRDNCDIVDFAKLHAERLDLPNTRSLLLISPPRYRMPFEPWRSVVSTGTYSPLPWWQAYNGLKHDLLRHINHGTLRTAIDALCGLHQVLARRIDIVPMLLRRGWFPLAGYNPEYILEAAANGRLPGTFIIQTSLFAVPIGVQQFPENVAELQPFRYQCKIEFNQFLGKL